MKTTNSQALHALASALDYAQLKYDEVSVEKLEIQADALGICHEIEFTSSCLRYYIYVDAKTNEVLGFLTVPHEKEAAITTAA